MSVNDRLGLEFISALAMPPVKFVAFAADLGLRHIGVALTPITANPYGYPTWSLRDDALLRREMRAAMADRGVAISLGEGLIVRDGFDMRDGANDMDLLAELGTKRVNTISIESDPARSVEQIALFAAMAAERGMTATLEYMAGMPIGNMAQALAAIDSTGADNLSLTLDCMHFARAGDDAAAIDPARIGYLQLCDVPATPDPMGYGEEARHNRLMPGDGDIMLAEILAVAPRDIVVGIEVPMSSRAMAGEDPRAYLAEAVAKSRELLPG